MNTDWSYWRARFVCDCGQKFEEGDVQRYLVCPICGRSRPTFRMESYRFRVVGGSFWNPKYEYETRP